MYCVSARGWKEETERRRERCRERWLLFKNGGFVVVLSGKERSRGDERSWLLWVCSGAIRGGMVIVGDGLFNKKRTERKRLRGREREVSEKERDGRDLRERETGREFPGRRVA